MSVCPCTWEKIVLIEVHFLSEFPVSDTCCQSTTLSLVFWRSFFLWELPVSEAVKEFGRPACPCWPFMESSEYHTKFCKLSRQWQEYRLRIVEKFQLQVPPLWCSFLPVLLEALLHWSGQYTKFVAHAGNGQGGVGVKVFSSSQL